jgi:hypothetical protein
MTDASFVDKTLVAPVQLDDVHGRWEFHPQADITVYELSLITGLFIAMVIRQTRLDWREFLTRERVANAAANGRDVVKVDLSRHFKDL